MPPCIPDSSASSPRPCSSPPPPRPPPRQPPRPTPEPRDRSRRWCLSTRPTTSRSRSPRGVGRGRRADVARRAARPVGAAHRPQRHAAPHRRRPAPPRSSARIPVYTHDEEGLQGVGGRPGLRHQPVHLPLLLAAAVHPGRRRPRPPATDWSAWQGSTRLSRFTLNADCTLNTGQRGDRPATCPPTAGMCCHVGGDIDFDAAGNLYLSTGDDTNPFESAGYTPIDERTNRNPRLRRPAHARPTPTTCAARSCGSR